MSNQWYIYKDQQQKGPFTWEQVCQQALSGAVGPADLVWAEVMSGWTRVDQVPGLMPVTAATGNNPAGPPARKKKKGALIFGGILLAVLIIAAGVFFLIPGMPFPFRDAGFSPSEIIHDVGEYYTREPDPAYLIETEDWGLLPANHVAIILEEGLGESDAERIAAELGAELVGRIEFINMYQLESGGTTEEDLRALLAAAANLPGVEIAVPNIPVVSHTAIEGRGCSPLNDPMYSEGNNGRAYEMIGLQEAWDIIRATGVELNRTRVGVIDQVIYTESGHDFSPELHLPDAQGRHAAGKVRTIPLDRTRDLTAIAQTMPDGRLHTGGLGHGTVVTHVVAADPGGGTVGVAGILGENLEVLVSVQGSGRTFVGSDDPDDPVRWGDYTYGMLERMLEQVQNRATVINLSWGPNELGPQNAQGSAMMRKFLRIMNERHPHVIFVGAAGNSGQGLDGNNDYWGKDLPNLITVGALNHNGGRAAAGDWYTREELEDWYREDLADGTIGADTSYDQYVNSLRSGSNYAAAGGEMTISASGTGVPVGVGPDGKALTNHGTSFAAPQVTAAAALMRSINPNLTAADIKRILTQTAARQVQRDGVTHTVPDNMGAGVLRVDQAILQVINEMRAGDPEAEDYPKLPPLDYDTLLGLSRVQLTAELQPGGSASGGREWVVTAAVSQVSPGGTELQLKTSGQGTVSGSTTQRLAAPGEVSWRVTVQDDHFTVRVFRLDTNGCAVLELNFVDLSGTWSGVWVITQSDVVDNPAAAFEVEVGEGGIELTNVDECEAEMREMMVEEFRQLLKKEFPMILELVPGEGANQYSGTIYLDFESLGSEDIIMHFTASFDGYLEFTAQHEMYFDIQGERVIIPDAYVFIHFRGSLEGADRLTGTFISPDIASGTWTVTRMQEQ